MTLGQAILKRLGKPDHALVVARQYLFINAVEVNGEKVEVWLGEKEEVWLGGKEVCAPDAFRIVETDDVISVQGTEYSLEEFITGVKK